jgi:predicted metalloprotease
LGTLTWGRRAEAAVDVYVDADAEVFVVVVVVVVVVAVVVVDVSVVVGESNKTSAKQRIVNNTSHVRHCLSGMSSR